MASTFSPNLSIELIGTGDQAGTWGTTTNSNLGTLIEQAISGYVTQAVATGTDTTITIPNGSTGVARNMYIELTGTGGASTNLIVPANKKLYFIFNNSTGAVTVKVSGQTGVSVPTGKKMVLVSNGTDIVNGLNYIADFGTNSFSVTNLTASSATITNLIATSGSITNLVSSDASATVLRAGSATLTHLSATSVSITNVSVASATVSSNLTLSGGTANGVLYLNGSKVATSGSALTFDGTQTFSLFATGNAVTNLEGSATNNAILRFRNGTTGALAGFYGNNSKELIFEANGTTEQMRLTSTGLGIGTASPSDRLDVVGSSVSGTISANVRNSATSGVYTATALRLYSYDGTSVTNGGSIFQTASTFSYQQISANQFNVYGIKAGGLRLATANSGPIIFAPTTGADADFAVESMRLTPAGNLGIGTASPGEKLDVVGGGLGVGNGTIKTVVSYTTEGLIGTTSNNALLLYTNNTERMRLDTSGNLGIGSTSPSTYGGLVLVRSQNSDARVWVRNEDAGSSSRASYVVNAAGNSWSMGMGSTANNGNALTWVLDVGGGNTEHMRLTTSGNLGLSAGNAPTQALSLYRGGSTNAIMSAGNSNTGLDGTWFGVDTAGNGIVNVRGAFPLIFSTNATERARITSGGDLLVGTTSAGAGISGVTSRMAVVAAAANFGGVFVTDSTAYHDLLCWNKGTSGDNAFIEFATEASYTNRGSITYNRGAGQVAYNTTSDVRLKENITDSADAGGKIDAMQVRQFDWKETGNHLDYGFVAQELHDVAPHAVSKPEDDDKMWSVDYSKLVPMLVKELQSLRKRVAELESK